MNYEEVYSAREFQLPLNKYSELIHYLLITLSDRFYVYYNRESTLGALRLALPRDKIVDVGLQILLRNDALRAGGPVWTRSRSSLAQLKGLWGPLLHKQVPENPVDRARGLLQLFKLSAPTIGPLPSAGVENLTLAENWRSRPGTELSPAETLLV